MEKTILIKLYRNGISCGEYSDLYSEDFERWKKDAAAFANSHGKRLLFTVCQTLPICDFDAFCEIVTDAELSEEEAAYYRDLIGKFCGDADISRGEMNEYQIPAPIFVYSVKGVKML